MHFSRLSIFLIAISLFLSINSKSQIINLSPLANSKFHNPETSIIIKLDSPLKTDSDLNKKILIIGSISDTLDKNISFSKDFRTIIIVPECDFKNGESVNIKIAPLRFKNNYTSKDKDYYFSIKKNNPTKLKSSSTSFKLSDQKEDYFPPITVNVNNNPAEGKIFFHNLSAIASNNDRFYAIIENDGTPYYSEQDNNKGLNFTLQKNGHITYWNNKSFYMLDSSYTLIDSFACGNGYEADWHEFQLLENGHAFLISWDLQIIDMREIVTGGQEYATVEGIIIQELDTDKNVIFQWRSWDHFQITDAVDVDFTTSYVSYTHGNALDIDKDGNILLSSRLMNEITKIDRNTGGIIWRLGGKNNDFTFINDDGFCRQHDIRQIQNGNITLYDNGTCHTPQVSSAKEYSLDEINKTATLVWKYEHPKKIYCETMGNVQRLSNGNTFINWGRIADTSMVGDNLLPAITEVRSDKTIAYELTFDTFFHMLYRSHRFDWDAAPPVSTENNTTNQFNDFKLFPVPTSNLLNIVINSKAKSKSIISIVNLSGKIVTIRNKELNPGKNIVNINTEGFTKGIYFCKITSREYSDSKKFIVIK